jgi:hypothetical protein
MEMNDKFYAKEVSRLLFTVAARVQSQVSSYGMWGKQSDTRAGFLRVLRFPLPILIPPNAPFLSSIVSRLAQWAIHRRSAKGSVSPHFKTSKELKPAGQWPRGLRHESLRPLEHWDRGFESS